MSLELLQANRHQCVGSPQFDKHPCTSIGTTQGGYLFFSKINMAGYIPTVLVAGICNKRSQTHKEQSRTTVPSPCVLPFKWRTRHPVLHLAKFKPGPGLRYPTPKRQICHVPTAQLATPRKHTPSAKALSFFEVPFLRVEPTANPQFLGGSNLKEVRLRACLAFGPNKLTQPSRDKEMPFVFGERDLGLWAKDLTLQGLSVCVSHTESMLDVFVDGFIQSLHMLGISFFRRGTSRDQIPVEP